MVFYNCAAFSRLVWKSLAALCFNQVGKETRREAPEVNSHARKRVVTEDKQNRGPKGRHI